MTRFDWPALLEEHDLSGRVSRTQLRSALLKSEVVGPTDGARADALIKDAVDDGILEPPYDDDETRAVDHPDGPIAFEVVE